MDLLSGSPYLLNDQIANQVLENAAKLQEDVAVLRKKGALSEVVLQSLRDEWRFKQINESAAIEGNELTLNETQIAIQRGITISGKPPEHSDDVRYLNNALQYLEELAKSKDPLSEHEIIEIQSLILGRNNRFSGVYRSIEVSITNSPHKPPHPVKVAEQMSDYVTWMANGYASLPVPLLAAVCHAWFVYIHPFGDGNGRTARAIMNLLLMRFGFPIVIIRKSDRQRYYEALRESDNSDITPLFELILDRSKDSLAQLDRVRTAQTGISIQLQRLRDQRELHYKTWLDGITLFRSTFNDVLKQIENDDSHIMTSFVQYDNIDFEDYERIINHQPVSNSWFFKFSVKHMQKQCSALFWVGYASGEMQRQLSSETALPCLKISAPNKDGYPPWTLPDATFCSNKREITYHKGNFSCLSRGPNGVTVSAHDNVFVLVSDFLKEVIGALAVL